RIPATRSRISASSSTIRISEAILRSTYRLRLFRLRVRLAGGGESYPHTCAALARNFLTGIAQLDVAAMLLDDAPDNRKAEARPLFARRDIRFEQAAAVRFGEPNSIVDDVDDDIVAFARRKHVNGAFAKFRGWNRSNRLGGILDDVGQRLGNQPPVK